MSNQSALKEIFNTQMKVRSGLTRLSRITFWAFWFCFSVGYAKTDHYLKHNGVKIQMFYSEVVIVIFIILTGLVNLVNSYHESLLN